MASLNAHVLHSGQLVPLLPLDQVDTPTVVPSTYIVIQLQDSAIPPFATLDDRSVPVARNDSNTMGYLPVDLFRSVGFHHLEISGHHFLFATEDGKLKLDGILKILNYIETEGLSWGLQLYFADGTALRHPKIDYAWLTRAGPALLRIAEDVIERPFRRLELTPRTERPRSGRPLVHQTTRLLRRNPRTLLEQHPTGLITIGDDRFMPRLMVLGKITPSFNTTGNRRLTWLLNECVQLTTMLRNLVPAEPRQAITRLQRNCQRLLDRFPFSQLVMLPPNLPDRPAPEEIADDRYRQSYRLFEELTAGLGWQPGLKLSSRSAFVAYSDEIYQAFVAMTIARTFGAQQIQPCLTPYLEAPTFRSDEYNIYYDTAPPKQLFSNWRDASSRPTTMRPDLTLAHIPSNSGFLLDAKYQVEPTGRVPTRALNECQVYMHSFGQNAIGICYPGPKLEMTEVSGAGKVILEISLSPLEGLHDYLVSVVRPRIEQLLEPARL